MVTDGDTPILSTINEVFISMVENEVPPGLGW